MRHWLTFSADAFSGFGRQDPKQTEANREVREHSNALYKVMQTFAEQLVRPPLLISLRVYVVIVCVCACVGVCWCACVCARSQVVQDNRIYVPSSSPDLTARLHSFGINNRFLGYLRSCLRSAHIAPS